MTQGKYGLNLAAVAILVFVLGFFGFFEAMVLVLAFAVILEKDPWLIRQALQALYLRIAYSVALTVVGWIFKGFRTLFGWFNAFKAVNAFGTAWDWVNSLLYIGLFALSVIAVLRLAKNKDAGVPVLGSLADATLGVFKPKPQPAPGYPPTYQQPAAPAYQAQPANPYQPPSPPVAPVPPPSAAAAPAAAPTPVAEPAAPPPAAKPSDLWTCACGRENNGNFCMSCGSRRSS